MLAGVQLRGLRCVQAPSGRTSLPWICDQLSMSWQGQVVDLRGHCVAPVGATPPSAGPLAGEVQPVLPAATPVSIHMVQPASRGVGAAWELQARPQDAELWTIASVGTTLRNGRIELPDSGFLVLDSSCEGFTMQNIVIRGACARVAPATVIATCPFARVVVLHLITAAPCARGI